VVQQLEHSTTLSKALTSTRQFLMHIQMFGRRTSKFYEEFKCCAAAPSSAETPLSRLFRTLRRSRRTNQCIWALSTNMKPELLPQLAHVSVCSSCDNAFNARGAGSLLDLYFLRPPITLARLESCYNHVSCVFSHYRKANEAPARAMSRRILCELFSFLLPSCSISPCRAHV